MAKVVCPKCSNNFFGSPLKGAAAALAGAATGAYVGSGVGIAGGPMGAVAGTIPGAVIGGTIGYFGSQKFYKCDKCGKVFAI